MKDKLKSAADTLNQVLASSDDLDEATRAQLDQVAKDLKSTLGEGADQQAQAGSIREQLKAMLQDLEAKHPHIAAVVTQLDDILAGIGI